MKNQTIIFKNLFSSIGLFLLFLILSGYELKAESFRPSEKKYGASNKIKWVRYQESYQDKEIETLKKDFKESNNQLISKAKEEDI